MKVRSRLLYCLSIESHYPIVTAEVSGGNPSVTE